MTNPPIEKRDFPRFHFELPIVNTEVDGGRELHGLTRDISRTGVFFYTGEQTSALQTALSPSSMFRERAQAPALWVVYQYRAAQAPYPRTSTRLAQ